MGFADLLWLALLSTSHAVGNYDYYYYNYYYYYYYEEHKAVMSTREKAVMSTREMGSPVVTNNPVEVKELIRKGGRCEAYQLSGQSFPVQADLEQLFEPVRVNASDLHPDFFFENFVKHNRPVLITGGASNLFRDAEQDFNFEALMAKGSGIELPVKKKLVRLSGPVDEKLTVEGIHASPERTIHFQAIPFPKLHSPGKMFRRGKGRRSELQSFDMSLQKEYSSKLRWPNFLQKEEPDEQFGSFNLHLSTRGGAIPHSHVNTLNLLFQGSKRWLIVNPLDYRSQEMRVELEQISKMNQQRAGRIDLGYTSQQWFQNEAEALLKRFEIPRMEFIQHEGDALFIPDFWTHATVDLCRNTVGVELMGEIINRGFHAETTDHFTEHGIYGNEEL